MADDDLARYQRAVRDAEELEKRAQRDAGALEQVRADARREFGIDDAGGLDALADELDREADAVQQKLDRLAAAFEEDYGGRL